MLASYSVADSRVLFWNTKPSITHIFSSPACVHSTTVIKTTGNWFFFFFFSTALAYLTFRNTVAPPAQSILESVKLQWMGEKSVELVRGWEGSVTLKW